MQIIWCTINCERAHSTVFTLSCLAGGGNKPGAMKKSINIFNLPLSFAIHNTKETKKSHI